MIILIIVVMIIIMIIATVIIIIIIMIIIILIIDSSRVHGRYRNLYMSLQAPGPWPPALLPGDRPTDSKNISVLYHTAALHDIISTIG